MGDRITKENRSTNMRAIRSTNTGPELRVRRLIHAMGYRYRLHQKDLPGKPDLVFRPRRKVIFIHGCFWHQHIACLAGHVPGSNKDYWIPKLNSNVARDAQNRKKLAELGWQTLEIWECEVQRDKGLRTRIRDFLDT